MSQPWRSRYRRASSDDTFFKYEPGSICWLKAKDDFADDVEGTEGLPDGCYNHPCVLLWMEGSGVKAAIFIITSFNGTPLEIRHQGSRFVRKQHLPISPSPPHPDSGLLLDINGELLPRNSYVKIEQVRVCSARALRPHGARKLTARSYQLLMSYAPAKPPSADIDIIQRYPSQARPYWVENAPLLVQDHSSRHSQDYSRNRPPRHTISFANTQRPHQYTDTLRTQQTEPLQQNRLHPYSPTSIPPRQTVYTYGTFLPQYPTSHTARPSRRPAPPSGDGFPYGKVCAAIIMLGIVGGSLFLIVTLAKTLVAMISQWIHNLFSGKVGAVAQFGLGAGKSVDSMILHRFRT